MSIVEALSTTADKKQIGLSAAGGGVSSSGKGRIELNRQTREAHKSEAEAAPWKTSKLNAEAARDLLAAKGITREKLAHINLGNLRGEEEFDEEKAKKEM